MRARHPIEWAIQNAYKKAKERGWDKIYWAIDIHETILKPSYDENSIGGFYPDAIYALKDICMYPESVIILWSSMTKESLEEHRDLIFDKVGGWPKVYLNENPEVGETRYANFDQKMYFNLLLDDKAGFNAESDWYWVREGLRRHRQPLK